MLKMILKFIKKIFGHKFNLKLLGRDWKLITTHKMKTIPRNGEFIFLNERYFNVLNVVYVLKNDDILVIIEEVNQLEIKN